VRSIERASAGFAGAIGASAAKDRANAIAYGTEDVERWHARA
jgi:hypothetical protein